MFHPNDGGDAVLCACIPDSLAAEVGLNPGDIIVVVDRVNAGAMTEYGIEEVVFWLLGNPGTKVKLTVERKGKIFNVEPVRR